MTFPVENHASDLLPSLKAEVARIVSKACVFDRPVFLHMLGVPGAGKSTFMSVLRQKVEAFQPIYVGFDKLMEAMPEYRAEADIEKAFKLYELPARRAGYYLLEKLIEKKTSILLDHGGSFSQNIDMLRFARDQKNYAIIVVRIAVDPETAKRRIWARQAIEGRHTPLHYVDERHGVLTGLLPLYKEVADHYIEVSNDEDDRMDSEFDLSGTRISQIWASV